MKKLLVFLSAVCIICCGVGFTGCSNEPNYSETFAGAISEHSYADKNEAAEGFLSEELTGEAGRAELVNYEKQRDMTEEQISGLNIQSLDQTEKVVAAEVVNITYKTAQNSYYSYAANEESQQDYAVFTVYILEISREGTTLHEFRYYVPKSELGQSLTSSYYKDLLNPEKYTNFTQRMTDTATSSFGISRSVTSVVKVDTDKAFLEQEEKYNYPNGLNWTGIPPQGSHILAYFEESAGNTFVWASNDGGETYKHSTTAQTDIAGITDIKSLITFLLPNLDYSFYEKTDYGFKIKEKYLNKYLASSFGSLTGGDASVNAQLNFYVVEGRLYKIVGIATAEYGIGNTRSSTSQRQEYTFTDYGTTVVKKPAGIE